MVFLPFTMHHSYVIWGAGTGVNRGGQYFCCPQRTGLKNKGHFRKKCHKNMCRWKAKCISPVNTEWSLDNHILMITLVIKWLVMRWLSLMINWCKSERKAFFRALTTFKLMVSVIPEQCSTNSAMNRWLQ